MKLPWYYLNVLLQSLPLFQLPPHDYPQKRVTPNRALLRTSSLILFLLFSLTISFLPLLLVMPSTTDLVLAPGDHRLACAGKAGNAACA
jgi:hypothetical protein